MAERTKRYKTENIRSNPIEMLAYATEKKLRSIGNRNGAEILKNVVDDPPIALEPKYLVFLQKRL